jgi:hypothetical protein
MKFFGKNIKNNLIILGFTLLLLLCFSTIKGCVFCGLREGLDRRVMNDGSERKTKTEMRAQGAATVIRNDEDKKFEGEVTSSAEKKKAVMWKQDRKVKIREISKKMKEERQKQLKKAKERGDEDNDDDEHVHDDDDEQMNVCMEPCVTNCGNPPSETCMMNCAKKCGQSISPAAFPGHENQNHHGPPFEGPPSPGEQGPPSPGEQGPPSPPFEGPSPPGAPPGAPPMGGPPNEQPNNKCLNDCNTTCRNKESEGTSSFEDCMRVCGQSCGTDLSPVEFTSDVEAGAASF